MPELQIERVAVIGLGKIGLPLVAQLLSKGLEVVGCDTNPSVIEEITLGNERYDYEPGLYQRLKANFSNLTLTTSAEKAARQSQIVIIVVPLIIDDNKAPDLSNLRKASIEVAKGMQPGTLIIYETTLPLGATSSVLTPLLEQISGKKEGSDFYTAYAPERVSSGTVFSDLKKYPKILGSCSPQGAKIAADFYTTVLDFDDRTDLGRKNGVWAMENSTSAEFVKLAETTFRDVNIALANTFAIKAASLNLNFDEIRLAANSQPFSLIHEPGISVGGHCIPVYPHLYLEGDPNAELVSLSRDINSAMPNYAVTKIESHQGDLRDSKIAILGLAYRPGVKEHAFSGAIELRKLLKERGAQVAVIDPLYSDGELANLGLSRDFNPSEANVIVINTNHEEFSHLQFEEFPKCTLALEGRSRILSKAFRDSVFTLSLFAN